MARTLAPAAVAGPAGAVSDPERSASEAAVAGSIVATGDAPRRLPGRPRDPRADEAILGAVVELLVEVGFSGLTIDAVAHRAGVGKATIYRRWDGKERLVLDALGAERQTVPVPDTGSLRADLLELYLPMAEPVSQQTTIRLLPALAAEAAVNPDLAEALRSFVSDRRVPARTILRRALERGEVAAGLDVELCIDQLSGPLLYRMLFTGGLVTVEVIERSIDLVLRSVAPAR